MSKTSSYKTNKVNLSDYDYELDIYNRCLMSTLSKEDIDILEEIVDGPTKRPLDRFVRCMCNRVQDVFSALNKLFSTNLFRIEDNVILVNKDARKYFESQMVKFSKNFVPGIGFLQSLLKKVPIHVLPKWYPIPRTADKIFESLLEKYLHTPQIFQQYLDELQFEDPLLSAIVQEVFTSPNYQVYAKELMEKYHLTAEELERCMLQLEFNFVCCLIYEEREDHWEPVVTFFHEWKEYLLFLKQSRPTTLTGHEHIRPIRTEPFAFVRDLSGLLNALLEKPLDLSIDQKERWIPERHETQRILDRCSGFDLNSVEQQHFLLDYLSRLLHKTAFLKLGHIENRQLIIHKPSAKEWLSLPLEQRAMHLYKQTLALYSFPEPSMSYCSKRGVHEIEREVRRLVPVEWILLEELMDGLTVSLSAQSEVVLKKVGHLWQYTLPNYSKQEEEFIYTVIMGWMFEGGLVSVAIFQGKECLRITDFGIKLWGEG